MSEQRDATFALLQLQIKLRIPPNLFLAYSREAAKRIASVNGLVWKVWISQPEDLVIGGVYLFETREAAAAYLQHPIVESLCSKPTVVSVQSQLWDVETPLSAITRAPLIPARSGLSEALALIAGGRR